MDLRAAVSHATAELGVRKNFYKFVQEPADHPLFSEAKKVNIEKLRQMPTFHVKTNLLFLHNPSLRNFRKIIILLKTLNQVFQLKFLEKLVVQLISFSG